MCGIFGIYHPDHQPINLTLVERSTSRIRHRGPDDEGYLLANTLDRRFFPCAGKDTDKRLDLPSINSFAGFEVNLAFGFRRLSILDLSPSGHQPMSNNEGNLWIVFNGEVYNYIELRDELASLGYHFKTGTDTEVILYAYQEWGNDCLQRFSGMFAFCILDQRDFGRKLFLARDPFGIKPLYYTVAAGKFAFASEIKALIDLPGVSKQVNAQNLNDYLRRGISDHNSETMFIDIKHLQPAHYLEVDLNLSKVDVIAKNYWNIDLNCKVDIPFKEAVEKVRELFLENVKLHLRSDVPVGAALSGGIDSSSIVASMRYLEPELPLHTFTYLSEDIAINEGNWADIISKSAGAIAHTTQPRPDDLVQALDSLIYSQDEPFGSTSMFAQHCVFRLANEAGIKVMLDGQGADELFAGYPIYQGARFSSLIRQWKMISALRYKINLGRQIGNGSNSFFLLTAGAAVLPSSLHIMARKIIGRDYVSDSINDKWFKSRDVIPSASIRPSQGKDVLREQLVEATLRTGLPSLLRYEDRNSMAFSIESRVPFLTRKMAEAALALPEEYLISKEGVSKCVFRESMRGIVSNTILDRKDKIGFQTPEKDWLVSLNSWVEQLLDKSDTLEVLNKSAIQSDWLETLQGKKHFNFRIWRYLNIIAWAQRYNVVFS